jgi:nickel/cobalt transporter (NiCoT) family protein
LRRRRNTKKLLSAAVALVVGGVEALALLNDRFRHAGAFWSAVDGLSRHLGGLGYAIIGVFVACWFASLGIHRLRSNRGTQVQSSADTAGARSE